MIMTLACDGLMIENIIADFQADLYAKNSTHPWSRSYTKIMLIFKKQISFFSYKVLLEMYRMVQ